MLISPPFLPLRGANEADEAFLARAMQTAAHGAYPVSHELAWHGGMHLTAPTENNQRLPVRAIADGTVVYARQPTARPTDAAAIDAHALGYNGWTDDGVIVIRHDNEIGANAQGQGTQVRFFSIYLHLNSIARGVQANQAINRKTEIGRAGMFEGEANMLHFEIVCDDENLERLIGRRTGLVATGADGRTDAVFGEMYFSLPADTPVHATRPPQHQPVSTGGAPLGEALFVGIRYGGGNAQVTTYRTDGTTLGAALPENNAEYNLYAAAGAIVQAYRTARAAVVPAHSAVYELLRFGRVLGPDALNPADTPHWRQIRTPAGQGWVNLNATGVAKFSDADAPHWAGWHLMDDHQDGDSRCNADAIRRLLDENDDALITRQEASNRLRNPAVQNFLKRVICKFPTEWHRGSVATRWNWLTRETPAGAQAGPLQPAYMTPADFPEFQRYVEALCFWEQANTGLDSNHWHFHPREFIGYIRQCGWISSDELTRIYPQTPQAVRAQYLLAVNQVLRKYLFNGNNVRTSHFFGQGSIESMGLRLMVEGSVSYARNPNHPSFQPETNGYYDDPTDLYGYFHNYERAGNDLGNVDRSVLRNAQGGILPVVIGRDASRRPVLTSPARSQVDAGRSQVGDGMKFRGRGFKQLTGRDNYSKYWVYRGWLNPGLDFDENWWARAGRRPAPIPDPQRISTIPYNCIDSGGQFCVKNGIPRAADGGVNRNASDAVSRIINQWDAPSFGRRFAGTESAYQIIGDTP
ncbi:hypothetical protein ACFOLC_15535 [Lysobacter cavernae]|uniref:M23 family peptidase n=1 Tax=Lysobacter cavernae TaxID=1685901 RepID=A0ABV7RWR9_9GAMM